MELLIYYPEKLKIFKGGFGRSATRLAAKIRGAAKSVAGLATKLGGNALVKGLSKFAGPVGLAMTVGDALYGGYKGWKKARLS